MKTITRRKDWPKKFRWQATDPCGCVYIHVDKPEIIVTGLDGQWNEWDSEGYQERVKPCGKYSPTVRVKSWRSSLRRIVEPKRKLIYQSLDRDPPKRKKGRKP